MTTHALTSQPRPWYREPMVWMVIGGPLVVVVASIFTFVVAVKNPDPVLDKRAEAMPDPAALAKLSPAEREAVLSSMLPAQKGRNHVASPKDAADDN